MPAACPALEDTCPHCPASSLCELVAGGWPLTFTPALEGMPAPAIPQTRPVALTGPVESRLAPAPPPPAPPRQPQPQPVLAGQVLHFRPPGNAGAACGARYGATIAAANAANCRNCARTVAFRAALNDAPAVSPGKRRNLDVGALIERQRKDALRKRRCAYCRNGLPAERLSLRMEHCARCQRPLPGIAMPDMPRGADVSGLAKMTPAAAYHAGYADCADWRNRRRRIYRGEGLNDAAYAAGWYAAARARWRARN